MPVYTWRDKKTGYEVDIYRSSFDDYRDPPRDEDLPEEERGKDRDWQRIIVDGPTLTNPNKGNW